jgi:hypothetical protein
MHGGWFVVWIMNRIRPLEGRQAVDGPAWSAVGGWWPATVEGADLVPGGENCGVARLDRRFIGGNRGAVMLCCWRPATMTRRGSLRFAIWFCRQCGVKGGRVGSTDCNKRCVGGFL